MLLSPSHDSRGPGSAVLSRIGSAVSGKEV